eukprot:CAMPEP_0119547272 /NCGR_PEP_ID=MMETSP1352-20130426/1418_1 /TAXON_ID=265584 /ORGANISM="Stauroneis constricta, Strain CCMP1120" /LENGTH=484 /DNA_ID=CAMNT_0007592135 /DNA_START=201 /DNA_END=1655 /DNA_ORIENTATION=-
MNIPSRYWRRRLETAMTCPSTSVGVNCCQFACCIPSVPGIDFPIGLYPDWMGNLIQSCPEVALADLVIPGTHDSGSYSIDGFKPFAAVGRTQNVSVLEQMHRGARFLDIRVAGGGKDLVSIWHGCLQGASLDAILADVHSFCQDFPNEFLIIELVAEFGRDFSPEQKLKCLDLVKERLGDKIFVEDDIKKVLTTPVKQLTDSGKQVCVLVHNRMYEKFEVDGVDYNEKQIVEKYGFFNSSAWMRSKWHNTREVSQLMEWNLEEVKAEGKKGKFLNNQLCLTPGVAGAKDIANLVLGWGSLQPARMVGSMYNPPQKFSTPLLHTFFQKNADENWNIVMLDYIDLCPALMSLLVGFNFSPFEIVLATVQYGNPNFYRPSMSVTSKVQSHVLRNKVLFLNVGKDFGTNFGTLTLAYRVRDKYYSIVIHFDGSSTIVLNEYNHMQAGSKEIPIADGEEEGTFNPLGGGTVLNWTKTDGTVEFDFDSPF